MKCSENFVCDVGLGGDVPPEALTREKCALPPRAIGKMAIIWNHFHCFMWISETVVIQMSTCQHFVIPMGLGFCILGKNFGLDLGCGFRLIKHRVLVSYLSSGSVIKLGACIRGNGSVKEFRIIFYGHDLLRSL